MSSSPGRNKSQKNTICRQDEVFISPELSSFDAGRLKAVAIKLRELFPTNNRIHLESQISPGFVDRLVEQVTTGFKGDVGVVPRQFLREFVDQLDLVDQHPDYDPMTQYGFTPKEPSVEEQHILAGHTTPPPDDAEDLVPQEDAW